jgi:O-succinylbenzoic acid--CoA ligase
VTRTLATVPADDPAAVLRALRAALTGDGPAVLPRAAVAAPAAAADADAVASTAAVRRALPAPDRVAQNIALVIETSGSTGVPKRVALSTDALLASAAASAGALAGRAGKQISGQGQWLLCLPAHYVAGSNVLVRSIAAGTEPVVMPSGRFDPVVFRDTALAMTGDERYVSLVPVQLARLVDAAAADASLLDILRRFDRILVGGQSLRPELRERAVELGLNVTRTYGSSETGGGCVYDGMPIGPVRARAVDGALELAGPVLAEGYLGDPERTAAAFHEADGIRWYRTGDLGTVADDGRVTVLGRADNVIISGGEKVLLDAVERCVRELAGMADAVVVAADSAEWGQVPVVVVAAGATPELAEIREHVASALGRAAAPARLVAVERMPLLASGKPDRVALRRLAVLDQPGAASGPSSEP